MHANFKNKSKNKFLFNFFFESEKYGCYPHYYTIFIEVSDGFFHINISLKFSWLMLFNFVQIRTFHRMNCPLDKPWKIRTEICTDMSNDKTLIV